MHTCLHNTLIFLNLSLEILKQACDIDPWVYESLPPTDIVQSTVKTAK